MSRITIVTLIAIALAAGSAFGQAPTARVGDVTRLKGQGINTLIGYGLVTGLDGTGDGGKFLPAMKALGATLDRFGADIGDPADLSAAKNIAVVMVRVEIPGHGAREGDQLDVSVTAIAAKSLEGGELLPTPLVYHDPTLDGLFGYCAGRVVVDGPSRTSGIIRGGARMERDVLTSVVATGAELRSVGFDNPWIRRGQTYVTLVLDEPHAGWSMAAAVAQAVDKELGISANVERVALAMDSKNVVVLLPEHQRGDPASWIRDVERTELLMESNEARVTINRTAGTIVVTGDTHLSPVVISQRGLTITVANPLADGETLPPPAFERQDFVPLDSKSHRLANVTSLLEALNRLKVEFEDRVSILEQVHRAGKLHARLMYEG